MMKQIQNKIPPPVIAFISGLLMWFLSVHFPIKMFDGAVYFYSGITFVFMGLYLDITSLFEFRKSKTTVNPISPEKATNLVVDGFYQYTRNPMYLGLLLILTGTALAFAALSASFMLPIFVIAMNELQIKPEEIALEKLFSSQYTSYKQKVRRWL